MIRFIMALQFLSHGIMPHFLQCLFYSDGNGGFYGRPPNVDHDINCATILCFLGYLFYSDDKGGFYGKHPNVDSGSYQTKRNGIPNTQVTQHKKNRMTDRLHYARKHFMSNVSRSSNMAQMPSFKSTKTSISRAAWVTPPAPKLQQLALLPRQHPSPTIEARLFELQYGI